MKRILLIPMCLSLFVSCRTTSGTYHEKRDIETIRQINSWNHELFSQSVIDSLFQRLSFSLHATITKFAPIDSFGRQSVESITEIDLTGEQLTEQKKVEDTVVDTEENNKEVDETTDKTNVSETTKTDTRVFRPPDWIWPILFVVIVLLVFKYRKKIKKLFFFI